MKFRALAALAAAPLAAATVLATSGAASAATWQDTSFQVNLLHPAATNPDVVIPQVTAAGQITLAPAAYGDTLAVNAGMSHMPNASVTATVNGGVVTLASPAPAPAGLADGTLVVDETSPSGAAIAEIVKFHTLGAAGGVALDRTYVDSPQAIQRSYPVGGVQFSEPYTLAYPVGSPVLDPAPAYSFAWSGLPSGTVSDPSGLLTVAGSTAAPGTYSSVGVSAADNYGAHAVSAFQFVVKAQSVHVPGNYGDEINHYGNGFDAYQQRCYAGAPIVGWTATKADPATHFIRIPGMAAGSWKFEYAPQGAATGLFVKDPGNGAGFILARSGSGEEFVPQADGTLRNTGTGLIVNPNGTGAQLRGGSAPVSWGGSVYAWTDYAHLPR